MNHKYWRDRIGRRSDFTEGLVHLTKPQGGKTALDILIQILLEKNLRGSTRSGYICGETPAVCFQDTPLHSLAENIYFEQQLQAEKRSHKVRYSSNGLRFSKGYVYEKGGRPVIYDKTQDAKEYLGDENYWRIVSFSLSNKNNYIDWTHEREWRVPNDMDFELSEVEILLEDETTYKSFIERCRKIVEPDILMEIKSIVVIPTIIF